MKTVANGLLLMICFSLLSCEDEFENSDTVDFGGFQVEVPSSWKTFTDVGYDSQVGGLTNGKDTLSYDYGWYSYNFSAETTETHNRTETQIDGREALIVQPRKKGKGLIGMFVQVDSLNRFSISGRSKDEKTVLRIFKSVRFE